MPAMAWRGKDRKGNTFVCLGVSVWEGHGEERGAEIEEEVRRCSELLRIMSVVYLHSQQAQIATLETPRSTRNKTVCEKGDAGLVCNREPLVWCTSLAYCALKVGTVKCTVAPGF